ncbi:transcriptional regulator [Sphingosinicella terrae]|uniref:transcriptional regulator n=1 Tax=Sphingosinicella terrae TaxID=2172047 RepID=UPI000E0D6CF7|nr:transcriptional regulator [Sphingosinicella terrae]
MDAAKGEAPYAYQGLDRVFHERARLGIVTSLAGHSEGLSFGELKALCDLTDGNLNRHLQVLEEAGFIRIDKGYEGRRPHTRCTLTEQGRARFADYLRVLEEVVRTASTATRSAGSPDGAATA